jgi:hypothetical protein
VSVSFAPLFLYWSGKRTLFPGFEWIIVPSCFALTFLVGLFYMRLGNVVIGELRKRPKLGLCSDGQSAAVTIRSMDLLIHSRCRPLPVVAFSF